MKKRKPRGRQKKPRLTDPINVDVELANIARSLEPSIMRHCPRPVDELSLSTFNMKMNILYYTKSSRIRFNRWARYRKMQIEYKSYLEEKRKKEFLKILLKDLR